MSKIPVAGARNGIGLAFTRMRILRESDFRFRRTKVMRALCTAAPTPFSTEVIKEERPITRPVMTTKKSARSTYIP
jgi:hypothetical protein